MAGEEWESLRRTLKGGGASTATINWVMGKVKATESSAAEGRIISVDNQCCVVEVRAAYLAGETPGLGDVVTITNNGHGNVARIASQEVA